MSKFFYSVGVSVETTHGRVDCTEIFGTNNRCEAIKHRNQLKNEITLGKWDHLLANADEFLTPTIEVHDDKTFELIEIIG